MGTFLSHLNSSRQYFRLDWLVYLLDLPLIKYLELSWVPWTSTVHLMCQRTHIHVGALLHLSLQASIVAEWNWGAMRVIMIIMIGNGANDGNGSGAQYGLPVSALGSSLLISSSTIAAVILVRLVVGHVTRGGWHGQRKAATWRQQQCESLESSN